MLFDINNFILGGQRKQEKKKNMSAWPAIRMFICMVRIHVAIFAIDDHSNAEVDVIYAALVMLLLEFKLNLQCQIPTFKKNLNK